MAFNANNYTPRLITVDDAMSLTRANITGWGKADIENMFFKEVGLDRIIAQAQEARTAGATQRCLSDLLMSRMRPGKSKGKQSVIQPFRLEPRRNRVNPSYFRVSTGVAAGGGAPDAHWKLTVNNGSLDADSSPLAKSPNSALKNPEKFFLSGHDIVIQWKDATTGVSKIAQMRVISTTAIDDNQCYLTVAPNMTYAGDVNFGMPASGRVAATAGWWEAADAAAKAGFQPTSGTLVICGNSVSNFESYAPALPGINDFGLVEYWEQTYRWNHKYNDQYLAMLKAATTSDGLKKFRTLELAKLRAQQEKMHEEFFFNTCFYGQPINEHQTTEDWRNLPQAKDPAWAASGESGELVIEFNSKTKGIRTQLAEAGRVVDMQGNRLDVDVLFGLLWDIKREREAESGQSVQEIDLMTDQRWTRKTFRQLMTKYFKAQYGLDNVTAYMQLSQKLTFNGTTMWEYDSYDLPDVGVTLKVISDNYFDDKIAAFDTANRSAGRGLWVVDWSDFHVNILKTRSVQRTNNLADDLYKYVIDANVQHVLLNSKTFEVEVGNCNRHVIVENFSDEGPKLTVQGADINAA